jgi:hypothetical protein
MTSGRGFDKPATYQIFVQGDLEHKRSDWVDGFAIQPRPNDETELTGLGPD